LIVAKNEAVVTPSPMMKDEKSKSMTGRDAERTERPPAETPAVTAPAVAAPAATAQASN
jgi:hypothetical protein